MKTILALAGLTLFAGSVTAAKKPIVWESAKVISQDLGSDKSGTYLAPIGTAVVAVPIYNSWNRVTVETADYIYQWSESGNQKIILPVNGEVRFYRDGDWFIVLDSKNKKHKFSIIGMQSKRKND
jgi:hypothetical protein